MLEMADAALFYYRAPEEYDQAALASLTSSICWRLLPRCRQSCLLLPQATAAGSMPCSRRIALIKTGKCRKSANRCAMPFQEAPSTRHREIVQGARPG
jgi:hypothetical protein